MQRRYAISSSSLDNELRLEHAEDRFLERSWDKRNAPLHHDASLSLSASSRNGRTPPPRFVLARVYVSPFNPFRNPNRNTISEKRGGRMEAEKWGGILVAGLQTWSHELISVKGYLNTGRVARLINDV